MALYDATDGANWTNNLNWKTDQGLSTWSGVTTGGGGRVTGLDLSFNSLGETIPAKLGDLTALQTLNFANNSGLSGGIPTQLGDLTALVRLNLKANDLTGAIPAVLGGMAMLRTLRLNRNSLSGSFPGRFPVLDGLNLLRSGACLPEGLFSLEELSYVGPICTPDSNTESLITVAVFYTPAAQLGQGGTAEIETLIDLMIAESNVAYADSGVKQRLSHLWSFCPVRYGYLGNFPLFCPLRAQYRL